MKNGEKKGELRPVYANASQGPCLNVPCRKECFGVAAVCQEKNMGHHNVPSKDSINFEY